MIIYTPYRHHCFLSATATGFYWAKNWADTLIRIRQDIIETGDPYVTAWASIDAVRRLGVPVAGFYHSDLTRMVHSSVGHWTDPFMYGYLRKLYSQFDMETRRLLARKRVCKQNGCWLRSGSSIRVMEARAEKIVQKNRPA